MRNGRNGEVEGLTPYLEAARALAPLSREEERALARRARGGDAGARDELVTRHLPLVIGFARRQPHGGVRLEELVQEGNLGLLRAVEKFDPDADTRFATYALWWIRAYVWKYLKAARSAVRPVSGTAAVSDRSLDAPVGSDEGDATHLDRLEDGAPALDARYADVERRDQLRGALALVRGRIGELGWDIVHSRLQRDPPDTLAEIGRRWNLSRERVRQVELRTKHLLREHLERFDEGSREAA